MFLFLSSRTDTQDGEGLYYFELPRLTLRRVENVNTWKFEVEIKGLCVWAVQETHIKKMIS